MSDLLIRGLDKITKEKLRQRAATNGRSLSAEAREAVIAAANGRIVEEPQESLAEVMLNLFGKKNGVKLPLFDRKTAKERPIPDFSGSEHDHT
jgi:plasmid stability protein